MFTDIFDIKKANYIPKPEISPYNQFIKDFNIDPESTIMFDDIRRNFLMNPQNGLRIAPFKNAAQLRATDKELLHLKDYLLSIAHLPSFTDLNHKNWNKKS